jgi:transcriptional regulator with XRE-family HTH domain
MWTKSQPRAATQDGVMAGKQRAIDRGALKGEQALRDFALGIREARLAADLAQEVVGRAVGLSGSQVLRIERARVSNLSLIVAGKLAAAVGLDLSLRLYPGPARIRDAAQVELLERAVQCFGAGWRWRYEVPLSIASDQRAWDAAARHETTGVSFVLDAETRIRDAQALLRREAIKRRDARAPRLLLLVADTRSNHLALRDAGDAFAAEFPVDSRSAVDALGMGLGPGGDAIVLL